MLKKVCCILLTIILTILFCSCEYLPQYSAYLANIGQYENSAYSVVHDNIPEFTEDDYTTDSFEYYSRLDMYDRCGYAMACVGQNLMPTEDRKSISHIKPTGWVNNSYEFIDGEYLYNRCHLIGFQLTGENDNEKNLITGTRYLNIEGMLPFENEVAEYIEKTNKLSSLFSISNNVYMMIIPDKNYYINDDNFLRVDYDYIYKENIYYQNFLLTSKENRAKFQKKIESNSKRSVNYL